MPFFSEPFWHDASNFLNAKQKAALREVKEEELSSANNVLHGAHTRNKNRVAFRITEHNMYMHTRFA